MNASCKVCQSETRPVFTKRLLQKYDVRYDRCTACGFMQTEEPYWLDEAYGSAIAQADIGLIERNIRLGESVKRLVLRFLNKNGRFLDYAGGYGFLTRLMRDAGLDFYHDDPLCENLYARHFTLEDVPAADRWFEMVTAFEMMEHLTDPVPTVARILSMTDNFLFSTELQPEHDLKNWWYYVPVTGQHVGFYTLEALDTLAKRFGARLYSDGHALHLITRHTFAENPLAPVKPPSLAQRIKLKIGRKLKIVAPPPVLPPSRLQDDFAWTIEKTIGPSS